MYWGCFFLLVGFLVDFIPVPVISGFTSAAAITIALGQVKVHIALGVNNYSLGCNMH